MQKKLLLHKNYCLKTIPPTMCVSWWVTTIIPAFPGVFPPRSVCRPNSISCQTAWGNAREVPLSRERSPEHVRTRFDNTSPSPLSSINGSSFFVRDTTLSEEIGVDLISPFPGVIKLKVEPFFYPRIDIFRDCTLYALPV